MAVPEALKYVLCALKPAAKARLTDDIIARTLEAFLVAGVEDRVEIPIAWRRRNTTAVGFYHRVYVRGWKFCAEFLFGLSDEFDVDGKWHSTAGCNVVFFRLRPQRSDRV